ncbi:MAG: dethiobiotin synthase [Chitinivibrionales bacterium]|nr:dethiobiotin synthase [Chitinivibrionales bacterium]
MHINSVIVGTPVRDDSMAHPQSFFVTGTDTEIGKTYVIGLLMQAYGEVSKTAYFKPVQTGCYPDADGILQAPDFEEVYAQSTSQVCQDLHVPYRFEPACSPHLAASLAGETISIAKIKQAYDKLMHRYETVLVEGAGGLLVPLSNRRFMIDLIAELGCAVIVVTSPRLGTLNHTMLTCMQLDAYKIPIAALVYNNHCNIDPQNFIYKDNKVTLSQFIAPVPLLETGYQETDNDSIRRFCHESLI